MSEFISGAVYLMPKKSNSFKLDGIFFVRSGIFKNASLRFTITLESSFPQQKTPPVLILEHPLFHPLVSESQVFDSSSAFPVWTPEDHIYELLKFFKYAIETIEFSCSVLKPCNSSAVEMYNTDRQKFLELSRESVAKSVNELFVSSDSDGENNHIFTFDKNFDQTLHDQILDNMKSYSDSSLDDGFSFSFDRRG